MRVYSAVFNQVAVTAAQDFFELLAATGKPIKILAIDLGQYTEVADAAEEAVSILLKRGVGVTSGSGGSTATPVPLDVDDTASGATVEINNTTKATGGTITTIASWAWNIRLPFCVVFEPERRPLIKPGDRMMLELSAATAGANVADSVTISGTIWFAEGT
jgi:hypothetical protein